MGSSYASSEWGFYLQIAWLQPFENLAKAVLYGTTDKSDTEGQQNQGLNFVPFP